MINDKLTALHVKTSLFFDRLLKDQRGVTAIEYALVAVAIATVVGVAFSGDGPNSLKGALQGAMQGLGDKVAGSSGG